MNMEENSKKAEAILKILANQKRLLILCNLVEGRKSVGDLKSVVNLSYSALSQHLGKMKSLNIIEDKKEGQEVFYFIKSYEVKAILNTLHLIYCR